MGILVSEAEERFVTLASHMLIGRSSSCSLRLKSRRVSGEHARLIFKSGAWELRDLASRNGTYHNGQRLEVGASARLSQGDTLAFGDAEQRYLLVDASPPVALARALDGVGGGAGSLHVAVDGILSLPDEAAPLLIVFEGPEGWIAEEKGFAREVMDHAQVRVGETTYVLHLPEPYESTEIVEDVELSLYRLDLRLRVEPGRKEAGGERVEVGVEVPGRRWELPAAPRYRILYALALARGFGRRKEGGQEGWVEVARLEERLGLDEADLARQILAIRRDLARLGIADAAGVIERHQKRPALRLGPVGVWEERPSISLVVPQTQLSGHRLLGDSAFDPGSEAPGERSRRQPPLAVTQPTVPPAPDLTQPTIAPESELFGGRRPASRSSRSILRTDELVGEVAIDGRYRLIRMIGEGGMGAVYLAEHVGLKKEVALKVLLPHFAHRAELVERFRREAKAASAVRHPHIIEVHDVGELPHGGSYMVLPYLRGYEWEKDFEARAPQALGRVARIVCQLSSAVAAAHRAGVLHRDLKPSNVFLTEAEDGGPFARVLDFGLSKIMQEAEVSNLTRSGVAMGTIYYMSPELTRDARGAAEASDLWAIGVMLYRALSGRYPFAGEAAPMLIVAVNFEEPPPLAELRPELPREVSDLVHRLLRKAPEDRPASATAVEAALLPFAE